MSMATRSKRGSTNKPAAENATNSSPPSKRTKIDEVPMTAGRRRRGKSLEDAKPEKDGVKVGVGRSTRSTVSETILTKGGKGAAALPRNTIKKSNKHSDLIQGSSEKSVKKPDKDQKDSTKITKPEETDPSMKQTLDAKKSIAETSGSTEVSDIPESPLRRTSRKRVLSKKLQDMELEFVKQHPLQKPKEGQGVHNLDSNEGIAKKGRKKEASETPGPSSNNDESTDVLPTDPPDGIQTVEICLDITGQEKQTSDTLTITDNTAEMGVDSVVVQPEEVTIDTPTTTDNTAEMEVVESVVAQPEEVTKTSEILSTEQQTAETAAILQELSDVLSSITEQATVQQEDAVEGTSQQQQAESSNSATENPVEMLAEPQKEDNPSDHSYGNSNLPPAMPVRLATSTVVEETRLLPSDGKGPNIVIVKTNSQQQEKTGGKDGQNEETSDDLGNSTVYVDVVLKDGLFLYKCQECDYVTNKKTNYYKHRKIHTTLRPHECDVCHYRTSTSSNLKRHMAQHTNKRNFKCTYCDLGFRQKIHLERHIKYRHEEKKVTCPYCSYVCANENPDLKQHIKRRHEMKEEVEGTFICHICNFTATKRKDLQQHMKFHKKGPELKFYCSHCSFVTEARSRLMRHELIHSKEKPYACGLCDYRATQREHVYRHMRARHNISVAVKPRKKASNEVNIEASQDQQPSVSDTIDTGDAIAPEVETEMEVPQDNNIEKKSDMDPSLGGLVKSVPRKKYDPPDYSNVEKLFACSYCTMSFAKLLNLYKHVHSMHSDIHPQDEEGVYSCVICDFRSSKKGNLLIHMRKHNVMDAEEDDDPYSIFGCMLCEYRNKQRRNLYNHMKKRHKISIVLKKDGTASCVVEDPNYITIIRKGEKGENMAVERDPITNKEKAVKLTDLARSLMSKQKMQVSNVISGPPSILGKTSTVNQLVSLTPYDSSVVHHEAVEAIQGLQALAGDVIIESDGTVSSAPSLVSPEMETVSTLPTATVTAVSMTGAQGGKAISGDPTSDIQLSAEQLMNLSSGDYIEINGEMYKVEFTTSDDTPSASGDNEVEVNQE